MGNKTINAELYRSALIKTLEEMEKAGDSQTDIADGVRRALRLLDMQDSVEAVEVVRCKDCKYSGLYCFGRGDNEVLACLEVEEDGFVRFATKVNPDHYCGCGERKE
jgi:hypothetical protein